MTQSTVRLRRRPIARPAKFQEGAILEAACKLVAANGPNAATISAIAHAIGAPNGSIYHRFRNRDELLGRLWLTKAAFFQDNFAAALGHPDPAHAAKDGALSLPRSVRTDPQGARIMLLHRRDDFLSVGWPPEMKAEAKRLAAQVDTTLTDMTRRLRGDTSLSARRLVTFALLDVPFAAVRRYVGLDQLPPPEVDELIIMTIDAILLDCRASQSA